MYSYPIRQHSANTLISLIAVVGSSLQYGAKWSVIWSTHFGRTGQSQRSGAEAKSGFGVDIGAV